MTNLKIFQALCAALAAAQPEADSEAYFGHHGYNHYGYDFPMRHSYGPYGYGYNSPAIHSNYGYGLNRFQNNYSYNRFYNNYNNGFYGKREAEAEPKAEAFFRNYGYGYPSYNYGYNRFYNNFAYNRFYNNYGYGYNRFY